MSTCPTPASDSYIQIDAFLKDALFEFTQVQNIEGAVETRAATGDLHVVSKYQREAFDILWPELNQTESNQLRQILSQVGINVLHTVIYATPEIIRKWDNSTPPGYGVNGDIGRIRKKIRVTSWAMPHHDNIANTYRAIAHCMEA